MYILVFIRVSFNSNRYLCIFFDSNKFVVFFINNMINDTNKTMVIFNGKLITYIYSQDLNKNVVFVSILKVSYQICINCAL